MSHHRSIVSPLLCACILFCLLGQTGCGVGFNMGPRTKVTRSINVPHQPGAINVTGRNGSITFKVDASQSDVTISAELTAGGSTQKEADERAQASAVEVTHGENGTMSISAAFPAPQHERDAARFVIVVPSVDGVTLTTSNGAVTLTGSSGTAEITTRNGAIVVKDHTGDATVRTSNGNITASDVTGSATLVTSNGRITMSGITGSIDATTSNGRIVADAVESAGPVNLTSTNGSLSITLGPNFEGPISAVTTNGRITFADNAKRATSVDSQSRRLHAQIGTGGAPSTFRTSNSSVTITISPE